MDKCFRIGDFRFRLLAPDSLPCPAGFLRFETASADVEMTFRVCLSDSLPPPEGEIIARRPDLVVYASPQGESRLIGLRGREGFYARYRELSDREAEVLLRAGMTQELRIDPMFASLFALERHMLRRDSLILHCAYTVCRGEAILFSGPSGIGKSTQAALWARYRGSRVVNGDRALLRRDAGRWLACGWPVCGSSGICEAEDTPVRAIVMLRQGRVNRVERLSPLQAFASLYAQITINVWNRAFAQQAMALIEALVAQAPVLLLTCDMTQDAVACLEEAVFPGAREESAMAVPGDGSPAGSTPRRD